MSRSSVLSVLIFLVLLYVVAASFLLCTIVGLLHTLYLCATVIRPLSTLVALECVVANDMEHMTLGMGAW